jgi:hypothetical protein
MCVSPLTGFDMDEMWRIVPNVQPIIDDSYHGFIAREESIQRLFGGAFYKSSKREGEINARTNGQELPTYFCFPTLISGHFHHET